MAIELLKKQDYNVLNRTYVLIFLKKLGVINGIYAGISF